MAAPKAATASEFARSFSESPKSAAANALTSSHGIVVSPPKNPVIASATALTAPPILDSAPPPAATAIAFEYATSALAFDSTFSGLRLYFWNSTRSSNGRVLSPPKKLAIPSAMLLTNPPILPAAPPAPYAAIAFEYATSAFAFPSIRSVLKLYFWNSSNFSRGLLPPNKLPIPSAMFPTRFPRPATADPAPNAAKPRATAPIPLPA